MSQPNQYLLIKLSQSSVFKPETKYLLSEISDRSNDMEVETVSGDAPLQNFLENVRKPVVMIPMRFLAVKECSITNKPASVDDFFNNDIVSTTPYLYLSPSKDSTVSQKSDFYMCTAVSNVVARNYDSSVTCNSLADFSKSKAFRLTVNATVKGRSPNIAKPVSDK